MGSRIVWVRLGSTSGVPIFLVGVYILHHAQAHPSAEDTLEELQQLLATLPSRAVVLVLGDFNAQLGRNLLGLTSRWSVHWESNTMGDMLAKFMGEHDLVAASTFFRPCRKYGGVATYKPFSDEGWHKATSNLDYALVSSCWQSSWVSSQVRWGPSEHRFCSGNGERMDHAMIVGKFHLRLRTRQAASWPDRSGIWRGVAIRADELGGAWILCGHAGSGDDCADTGG